MKSCAASCFLWGVVEHLVHCRVPCLGMRGSSVTQLLGVGAREFFDLCPRFLGRGARLDGLGVAGSCRGWGEVFAWSALLWGAGGE